MPEFSQAMGGHFRAAVTGENPFVIQAAHPMNRLPEIAVKADWSFQLILNIYQKAIEAVVLHVGKGIGGISQL